MEKTSLIVEGGGMRGIYAAGILDCMVQHGLYWNNVYGVSAGACHSLSYISRQFDRARRVNVEYARKQKYSGLFCILRHGTYFGFDYIFRKIPLENPIDWHTFFNNQSELRQFIVTVTNATTGQAEYKIPTSPEEAIIWLEASSSLPIIGKSVKYQNQEWFDGGISDSIPIKKAIQDGHSKHILILTQPKGYQKKPISNSTKKMLNIMYKKYPALIKANLERSKKYNKTLDFISNLEAEGNAFVFRPEAQVITGRLCKDKAKLQKLYQAGYSDCESRINDLKNFANTVPCYRGETN
ncbi:MAG: patatin family protein [Spirochaetaceae bacterium]|nr:patatin family protein [Spirochaetaceae bacterium]